MIRMFVNGHEAVYNEKDIVVFVLGDEEKQLIASMAEEATCLAIFDPEIHTQKEVADGLVRIKQICAVSPLTRA